MKRIEAQAGGRFNTRWGLTNYLTAYGFSSARLVVSFVIAVHKQKVASNAYCDRSDHNWRRAQSDMC